MGTDSGYRPEAEFFHNNGYPNRREPLRLASIHSLLENLFIALISWMRGSISRK